MNDAAANSSLLLSRHVGEEKVKRSLRSRAVVKACYDFFRAMVSVVFDYMMQSNLM